MKLSWMEGMQECCCKSCGFRFWLLPKFATEELLSSRKCVFCGSACTKYTEKRSTSGKKLIKVGNKRVMSAIKSRRSIGVVKGKFCGTERIELPKPTDSGVDKLLDGWL